MKNLGLVKNIVLLVLFSVLFTACANKYEPLETVKSVDIKKYSGTWYEIARFEHFFEKGCKNVTASYSLKSDGDIKVINRCTLIENNNKKEAIGTAYAVDETNSKLKVSFFRPFYGDYWILDLQKDYEYAVVGSPSREYLWILSRSKTLSDEIKNEISQNIKTLGFDSNKLLWTIQD